MINEEAEFKKNKITIDLNRCGAYNVKEYCISIEHFNQSIYFFDNYIVININCACIEIDYNAIEIEVTDNRHINECVENYDQIKSLFEDHL